MDTDSYIELASGARYYPGQPHTWDIEDIAHALGNQCRYSGHCRHFYSVAEHSVIVSLLAEELKLCDPFEALMHDAHESVVTDMASPWKPHLPDYVKAERNAAESLRLRYELPLQVSDGCKRADMLALFMEAHFLMKSKGEGWVDILGVRVDALKLVRRDGWRIQGLDPQQAKNAFLVRYRELMKKRHLDAWWVDVDMDLKYQTIENKRG